MSFIQNTSLLIIFAILQLGLMILFGVGYYLHRKSKNKVMKNKSFSYLLITKILNYCVVLLKTLLLLPLTYHAFNSLIS
jgi:succinate dehydrogenase/fumarate reductase cytochrome b subunit